MKRLTNILFLFVICNKCYSQYSDTNYKQQQQLLQEEMLQQQIQLLQQQLQQLQQAKNQDKDDRITNLNIILPKAIIDDFEYIPTVQGYRFSYQLPDGSTREENAFITGLRMDDYSRMDSRTTDFTAVGIGGRPKKEMLKNRKLSPNSLKSLSG